jgi:hypothetical protein
LTGIPNVEWARFAVLLDTYPCDEKVAAHIDGHAVPVTINIDDFRSATEGSVVTKFIMLKEQPEKGLAYLTRQFVAGRDSVDAIQSEGKTVLAIQLARDFAQLGVEEPKEPSMPRNGFGPPQPFGQTPLSMPSRESSSDVSLFRAQTSQLAAANRVVADAQDKLRVAELRAEAGNGSAIEAAKARREYEEAILNQKLIQEEYTATLHDLDLQVKGAQSEADAAKKTVDRHSQLPPGSISVREMEEVKSKLDRAVITLQRLQLRQTLYQKAADDLKANEATKKETPAFGPQPKQPGDSSLQKF